MAYVPDFDKELSGSNSNESIYFDDIKLSNGKLRISKSIDNVVKGGKFGLNLVGSLLGVVSPVVAGVETFETIFSMTVHGWSLFDNIGNIGLALVAGWVAKKTVPILVRNVPYLGAKMEEFKENLEIEKMARDSAKRGK